MNPNPDSFSTASESALVRDKWRSHFCRHVSWGAIFAGVIAALALQVLFMLLGAGLGFATYSPITDENPIAELGKGSMLIEGISAVFSLWFGGWVAGRFTPVTARATAWLHGFSVWCAITVAGVFIVALGAGSVLGDLSTLIGGGLSLAGKPAAALVGNSADMVKNAAKQSEDTLASFTDEAVNTRPADAAKNGTIRAKREVGLALARFFSPAQQDHMADNRTALVQTLVDTGMSHANAEQAVADWTVSYNRLKADLVAAKNAADAKAREIADKVSSAMSVYSLCAFVAFLLGALAAGCGGKHGAICALKCENRCTLEAS